MCKRKPAQEAVFANTYYVYVQDAWVRAGVQYLAPLHEFSGYFAGRGATKWTSTRSRMAQDEIFLPRPGK